MLSHMIMQMDRERYLPVPLFVRVALLGLVGVLTEGMRAGR